MANDVPFGAKAVWTANGHVNPVFYTYAVDDTGNVSAFRRNPGSGGWFKLQGIGASVLDPNTLHGPLYVDPYDAEHLFILTSDGVRVPNITPGAQIGAFTPFVLDKPLTELVTASGEYPLNQAFTGGVSNDVVLASQNGGTPKAILAQMAFNPYNSQIAIAASPVTGLFYQPKRMGVWKTLTPFLPTPYTMTSDVAADSQAIYVGMEGRGVWRLLGYDNAKLGCYYDRSGLATGELARLVDATSLPVPNANVALIVEKNGQDTLASTTTGPLGQLTAQNTSGSVVHLSFPGNGQVGPCETSISM